MKHTEPVSQRAIFHKKMNSSISTRPPHPGQKSKVMPVFFILGGVLISSLSLNATLCAVRPRIAMHRQPMSAFKTYKSIVVCGIETMLYGDELGQNSKKLFRFRARSCAAYMLSPELIWWYASRFSIVTAVAELCIAFRSTPNSLYRVPSSTAKISEIYKIHHSKDHVRFADDGFSTPLIWVTNNHRAYMNIRAHEHP
jgi:hypothetical protein